MTSPIPKASKVDILRRISAVKRMMLQCKERAEIVQFASENWLVTERQAYTYMVRARREIQAELSRRDNISLTWHIKARQNIINHSMENNEPRVALAAMRDIAELQGLYVQKHEHTGKDGAPIEYIRLPETAKE